MPPPTITGATAYYLPLRYRLMRGRPADHADGTLDHILLKLETSDGLTGWGEGFGYRAAPMTYAALRHAIGPALIGLPSDDIPGVIGRLDAEFHQAGRHGAVLFALSAVDIALWDIAGKRAGVPVYALLGKAIHHEIQAYASLLRMGDAALMGERVRDALGDGYGHIKLHEITEAEIRAARDLVPEGAGFMLDINCAWSLDEACAMAMRLRDCKPTWLEEPIFPPDDLAALHALRKATAIPLATGENIGNPRAFSALIASRAADFIQPSVTKVGGISAMLQVLAEADAKGQTVRPHCAYFGPGYWANLHLLALRDDAHLAEFYYVADLPDSLYGEAIWPKGGRARVPDGPGLGIDPDAILVQDLHRPPKD